MYDPRLGRWLSLDPMRGAYPSMTPYCYAGNTPIAAKDPDGNLIIFVNGYIYGEERGTGDDLEPGRAYWYKQLYKDIPMSYDGSYDDSPFIMAAKNYFNDPNALFVNGTGDDIRSRASDRRKAGYEYAELMEQHYRAILADLGPDEKIEFITHSMGGIC